MSLLEVRDIDVFYGDSQALWGVSFDVERGSITSIVGANGAGKTTIMKTISGLLVPRRGTIRFNGIDITKMEPSKRVEMGIALVPEGRQLFPRLTVWENLRAAAYTKRARERFEETLEEVFDLFPILRERRNQLAGTLSGGEQQMLAIARGLILRPEILMFDEPSLGLAPKLVTMILRLIRDLREKGYTILLVEQNVYHALKMSDRAYVLETGRIVKSGTGEELLRDEDVKKAYLGL